MREIHCKVKLYNPKGAWGQTAVLSLPRAESKKLPSRGMVLVNGTFNRIPFAAVLEPDGLGSHWFKPKNSLLKKSDTKIGSMVTLKFKPNQDWPEPKIPTDWEKALKKDAAARSVWQTLTPMARWDWIRWISSAKQQGTRTRRVDVACSKLKGGKRRPCCFDRTQCTLTDA